MKQLSTLLVPILGLGLGLGVAACGGGGDSTPDAGPPVDAAVFPPRAVIVAGDFKTAGVLSTLDLATREVTMNVGPAMAVGTDPMLRHVGNELFVINRAENNITILDDQTFALKEQLGTGPDSNPQDVAVIGNKIYVPTFGTKGVTVLTRGSTATTVLDLSAGAPDGTPDCNSAYAVGNDVYVSCELLDGFAATLPGKVYVIDSASDTVKPERTVTLLHKNPFGLFERIPSGTMHAGDLVIATVNDFVEPGCLERFTPGAAPSASSCWVNNVDLKGYASRAAFQIVPKEIEITYIAVPGKFPAADLLAFDMPTDLLWAGALNPTTQIVGDLVVCPGGELVIYDPSVAASGLRVYNVSAELTKMPLPIGIANGKFSSHGLACY